MINGFEIEGNMRFYSYLCKSCKQEIGRIADYAIVEIDLSINPEEESNRIYYCPECGKERMIFVSKELDDLIQWVTKMQAVRK